MIVTNTTGVFTGILRRQTFSNQRTGTGRDSFDGDQIRRGQEGFLLKKKRVNPFSGRPVLRWLTPGRRTSKFRSLRFSMNGLRRTSNTSVPRVDTRSPSPATDILRVNRADLQAGKHRLRGRSPLRWSLLAGAAPSQGMKPLVIDFAYGEEHGIWVIVWNGSYAGSHRYERRRTEAGNLEQGQRYYLSTSEHGESHPVRPRPRRQAPSLEPLLQ